MSIDIKVEGKPESARGTASWLRDLSTAVDDCADSVRAAGGNSEAGWGGDAGPAFRAAMHAIGGGIDGVAATFGSSAQALDVYADDIDTVKTKMDQAKQVAVDGGLTVSSDTIHDPGSAPADPGTLPENPTPEERGAHKDATAALEAYVAKVEAYQEAGEIVTAARRIESRTQNKLIEFAGDQVEKSPFSVADFATGIAGAVAARTSTLRTTAATMAQRVNDMYKLTDKGPRNAAWLRTAMEQAELKAQAGATEAAATSGRVARFVDRLPVDVKGLLRTNLDAVVPSGWTSGIARGARTVLSKVPVVGLAVTAAGIGYDIHSGKDPTKAVASGVGAFAAGAAVGAVIGGPVGVVVGGLVGIGVGYVIDEWGDEIADAAGDAVGAVKNFAGGLF